jgi:hypothetical protein
MESMAVKKGFSARDGRLLFQSLDFNGDGVLGYAEFCTIYQGRVLTLAGMIRMAGALGLSEPDCAALFATLDVDRQGYLSYLAFSRIFITGGQMSNDGDQLPESAQLELSAFWAASSMLKTDAEKAHVDSNNDPFAAVVAATAFGVGVGEPQSLVNSLSIAEEGIADDDNEGLPLALLPLATLEAPAVAKAVFVAVLHAAAATSAVSTESNAAMESTVAEEAVARTEKNSKKEEGEEEIVTTAPPLAIPEEVTKKMKSTAKLKERSVEKEDKAGGKEDKQAKEMSGIEWYGFVLLLVWAKPGSLLGAPLCDPALYKAPLSTSSGSDEGARSENGGGSSSNISSDLPWVVTAVVPCGSKASGNPTGFGALGCPTTAWDYGEVDAEGRPVVFAAGESSLLSDCAAATSTAEDAGLSVWPPAYGADRSPDKGAVIAYFPRAKLAVVAVHLHGTSKAGVPEATYDAVKMRK